MRCRPAKYSLLLVLCFALLLVLSLAVSAHRPIHNNTFTGNVTLQEINLNSSAEFNFTNRTAGKGGYIQFFNTSYCANIKAINGAELWFFGSLSYGSTFDRTDLFDEYPSVPNKTFADPVGQRRYTANAGWCVFAGDVLSFHMPDDTYALVMIKSVYQNNNVSFEYLFNNQTTNNSFYNRTGCFVHQTDTACFAEKALDCYWGQGLCRQSFGFDEHSFAGCEMLPKKACDSINSTVCLWDAAAGKRGLCTGQSGLHSQYGYNCTAIINETFCANQAFTEGTGLCSANATNPTICIVNKTKTFADVANPPVFSCQATIALNNQSYCQNLSDTYYMPCGWNNQTNKCEDLFIDFGKFHDFDDINGEDACKMMGGTWKEETAYEPLSQKLSSEKWCEFGVAPPTFDKGGSGKFFGNANSIGDCSRDCFACEFNTSASPPVRWASSTVTQNKCQESAAACTFRSDTNAFNGYGWCEPAGGFRGGFSCDTSCGDCNTLPNPQPACLNSTAQCRWDNASNACMGQGAKGCNQDCFQCYDKVSCDQSAGNGGCLWDTSSYLCKPKGGSYEICYDGVDNDNNGKTDCADFKCSSDSFCGGGITDTNNCFQFDIFKYGGNAQGNCTATIGCSWITDDLGFTYCGSTSDLCWQNKSFYDDQAGCNNAGGGNFCTYVAEGICEENASLTTLCSAKFTQGNCLAATGCKWNAFEHQGFGGGGGYCEIASIVECENNITRQNNQSACISAGCIWQGNSFSNTFEGGFEQNCISPCINPDITTEAKCVIAENATFYNGTCRWYSGSCEPKNNIGSCPDNDGDYTACTTNNNCKWFVDPYGGSLRHPNGSTNFRDYIQTGETWLGIGLQQPASFATNVSIYGLNGTGSNYVKLVISTINLTNVEFPPNISLIICNGTIIARYNISGNSTKDGFCSLGSCNAPNSTYTCGGKRLHYYLNKTAEALWEVPVGNLVLDFIPANSKATDTPNISTVKVDGLLGDQAHEPATANDGQTNATRVRTQPGFCDGKLGQASFSGMDSEPPIIVAIDVPDDGLAGHPYTDVSGVGVKKTPQAYMYGIRVQSINGSSMCFNVPLAGTSTLGAGKNQSKYYLYLDTDGVQTGGCTPPDNSTLPGFEYFFKYTTEIDSTNKLVETKISQSCSNGTWISSNVPLNSDKNKACSFVGGPIFAIDAGILGGKKDVNASKSWRAYGTSASLGGNASNITDRSFTGKSDFKGIDVDIVDCWSTEDKDNSQCNKFKQFGFSPGEFGPACADNKDNDADALTDCADYDCKFDPFFCSSSSKYIVLGEPDPNDETAPTITSKKINDKVPTALSFIYGTDEPSNASVKYYYTDSTCGTLNATFNDESLGNADTFDDYRSLHIVDVTGLAANKTYFYKLQTCDPSDNCAVSKCINATTATTFSNITFKIEVPSGWALDIPSINLSNFSKNYALKVSSEYLDNVNMTINQTNSSYSIKLVGVDIFEKQTLNMSRILTSTDLFSLDANQYQYFKQKTGLDKVIVHIPIDSEDNAIQHCDDDGAGCADVTSKLSCTFKSTYTECIVPEAVGLGFSGYKSVGPSGGGNKGGSGGSSSGGGGSSGGAAGGASVVSQTQAWTNVAGGSVLTMSVAKADLAVTSIVTNVVNSLASVEIKATGYGAKPEGVPAAPATAYQYLEVTTTAQKSDLSGATISFTVDDAWLQQKNVNPSTITLYRYSGGWTQLSTTYAGLSGNVHAYTAETPGFSYFAIAGEQSAQPVAQQLQQEITGAATQPVEVVEQPAQVAVKSGRGAMFFVALGVIGIIVLITALVLARRKNY